MSEEPKAKKSQKSEEKTAAQIRDKRGDRAAIPAPPPMYAEGSGGEPAPEPPSAFGGATSAYGEPSPCEPPPCEPPTPLQADPQECGGDLAVLVFAYPKSDGNGPFREGYQRLSHVEVIIAGDDYSDSQRTNERGEVLWHDIPKGPYRVVASPRGNYQESESFLWTSDTERHHKDPAPLDKDGDIDVGDASEVRLEIGFAPEPALLTGFVYYDCNRSGNPRGQAGIDNVPMDFSLGSKRLDCTTTSGGGFFRQEITSPGLITIAPRQPIKAGGLMLQRPDTHPIIVQADAGQQYDIPIGYVERLGSFQLVARLEQETGCKAEQITLPGVTFSLYRGTSASGDVVRQSTTIGSTPALINGLPPFDYTIVATGPKSYLGQAIEICQPAGGVYHYFLGSGQVESLIEFIFKPCLGRVSGSVTNGCGLGLAGVTVMLTSSDKCNSPRTAVTDKHGQYGFANVAPGQHVVCIEQELVTLHDGTSWEVPQAVQSGKAISVSTSAAASIVELQLEPEQHKIYGTFRAPDGSPLRFLRVDIQDLAGTVHARLQTDTKGYYEWISPTPGSYFVVPHTPGGVPLKRFPAEVNPPVNVSDILDVNPDVTGLGSGSGSGGGGFGTRHGEGGELASDLQSYPVLTEEMPAGGPVSTTRPAAPGTIGGTSAIGVMADRAIREVLSWRTKSDDPKGFVGALNQAFDLRDVEGHTEWTWTPRSYTVQTDMGAVTGAQASIYTRAKVALDQSLPLLDGLYPLIPYVEAEDLATVQAVVRSQFTALVDEFGVVGGPRVPRVDEMFELLLGPGSPTNPEHVPREASLGLTRQRFGLERRFVTTVDDEQNLTNYMILADYVIGLKQSWNHDKDFFVRNGATHRQPFFGTQLVLIARALDVVAQGVQDAYFAMDSVFMGDAERQTAQLNFANLQVRVPNPVTRVPELYPFPPDTSGLFVAELLDWVDRSTSQELPALLQDAGKDGLDSFKNSTNRLRRLVHGAVELSHRSNPLSRELARGLPPGYHTPRVRRAMQLLAEGLDDAYSRAFQVRSPEFPAEISQNRLDRMESELRQLQGLLPKH